MYTCSICGKKFDKGATIIGTLILCPDCGNEYDELIAEITSEILEKRIKNEPIDVNAILSKYQKKLEKFDKIKARIKMTVLSNVFRLIER